MSDIDALVGRVEQHLAGVDQMSADYGVERSDFCEVRRADVEALLDIARRYADSQAWFAGLGPVGQALFDGTQGGRRG